MINSAIIKIAPTLLCLLMVATSCVSAQLTDSTTAETARNAQSALVAGEYAKAIEHLQKLSKLDPDNANYHFTLADAFFMHGQMDSAVTSYDRVIELQPDVAPACWQRGLALYYADEFERGKAQFETHQTVNRQDVENSVWHLLCHARIVGVDKARESMIPISGDQRVPMPEVFDLFAGTGSVEQVMKAANPDDAANDAANDASDGKAMSDRASRARKMQLYYAHLYIGLWQEMMGQPERSIESMKKASELNPIAKTQLMGSVADVHLKLRDPNNRNQRP